MPNTWGQGSTRAWRKTRLYVLDRDGYQCQIKGANCIGYANEVDHITNIASLSTARRDATDPRDCQAACHPCHDEKTRRERRRPRQSWHLPAERHPGLR